MTELSKCARKVTWPGGKHHFDLGSERALGVLAGDPHHTRLEFARHGYPLAAPPLVGQFGDTPAACLRRFQTSVYSTSDVKRVLEIGLYGAGMPATEAIALVAENVDGKPIGRLAMIAYGVLLALFMSPAEIAAGEAADALAAEA